MNVTDLSRNITIRELDGIPEMVEAEALQKSVWDSITDYDNKDILIAIQHAGGLVAGAFTLDGSLVGFIMAIPTLQSHGLHSHRLAVPPAYRNQHIGESLKWFQREWGLQRKVEWIQWTFDPLLVINAYLNIHRLGAISNEYHENCYGLMDGINTGTPSDRIKVVWHLNSPRVQACFNNSINVLSSESVSLNIVRDNIPEEVYYDKDASILRINLPNNFPKLLKVNPNQALEWRLHVRNLLVKFFNQGYCITGFSSADGPAYLLQKYSEINNQ